LTYQSKDRHLRLLRRWANQSWSRKPSNDGLYLSRSALISFKIDHHPSCWHKSIIEPIRTASAVTQILRAFQRTWHVNSTSVFRFSEDDFVPRKTDQYGRRIHVRTGGKTLCQTVISGITFFVTVWLFIIIKALESRSSR